jgi:hypothetical protein
MQSSKMSFKNMMVAPHHLATKVGADILKDYDKFINIYENKSVWLNNADNKLSVKLLKLLSDTSLTLGARSQKRIPRETGLFLAKCNSGHTDISLSF